MHSGGFSLCTLSERQVVSPYLWNATCWLCASGLSYGKSSEPAPTHSIDSGASVQLATVWSCWVRFAHMQHGVLSGACAVRQLNCWPCQVPEVTQYRGLSTFSTVVSGIWKGPGVVGVCGQCLTCTISVVHYAASSITSYIWLPWCTTGSSGCRPLLAFWVQGACRAHALVCTALP